MIKGSIIGIHVARPFAPYNASGIVRNRLIYSNQRKQAVTSIRCADFLAIRRRRDRFVRALASRL